MPAKIPDMTVVICMIILSINIPIKNNLFCRNYPYLVLRYKHRKQDSSVQHKYSSISIFFSVRLCWPQTISVGECTFGTVPITIVRLTWNDLAWTKTFIFAHAIIYSTDSNSYPVPVHPYVLRYFKLFHYNISLLYYLLSVPMTNKVQFFTAEIELWNYVCEGTG